jgi:hypothetical protein
VFDRNKRPQHSNGLVYPVNFSKKDKGNYCASLCFTANTEGSGKLSNPRISGGGGSGSGGSNDKKCAPLLPSS